MPATRTLSYPPHVLHHAWSAIPLVAAILWSVTLVALLVAWLGWGVTPSPRHSTVLFISYIAAEPAFKPFFVVGTFFTSVFLVAALCADRYSRSLLGTAIFCRRSASLLNLLSIIFGAIAGIFLILLSLYDSSSYRQGHWTCAGIAFACVSLSLGFNLGENEMLRQLHPGNPGLRISGILKLVTLVIAIISIVTMFTLKINCRGPSNTLCNTSHSIAAVAEWILGLMVGLYVCTLALDLSPISRIYFKEIVPAERLEIIVPEYIEPPRRGRHNDGTTHSGEPTAADNEDTFTSWLSVFRKVKSSTETLSSGPVAE